MFAKEINKYNIIFMNENYYNGFKWFIHNDGRLEENDMVGLYDQIPILLMEVNAEVKRDVCFRLIDEPNSSLFGKLMKLYLDVSFPFPKEWMYMHNEKAKETIVNATKKAFPNKTVDPLLKFLERGAC